MKKVCITWASRWIWKSISDKFYWENELHLLSSSLDSFKNSGFRNAYLYWYDLIDNNWVDNFVDELMSKTDLPKPVNIESIDIGHQNQWRWWNAPWSPSITD